MINNIDDDLLKAREVRRKEIEEVSFQFPNQTIICIKMNVVGTEKNTYNSKKALRYFINYVEKQYDYILSIYNYSIDGNYALLVIDEDFKLVKTKMVEIEENHYLGRLVDLDVYYNNQNRSRSEIGLGPRKCYLCEEDAFLCIRKKEHTIQELMDYFNNRIDAYFQSVRLSDLAFESLLVEVFAYPKFSLVSAMHSGKHKDMDVYTFIQSAIVLRKYFLDYALNGLEAEGLSHLRDIGKKAESSMFGITGGINTHKGANFLFGYLITAIMRTTNLTKTNLHDELKNMSKGLINDFNLITTKQLTYGEQIYIKYGLMGVRGEIISGLDQVLNDYLLFFENSKGSMNERLVYTLIYIMSKNDDTTLLHHHDINVLDYVKKDMKYLLEQSKKRGCIDNVLVEQLTKDYISKGISPGGSADLLAVVYFLHRIILYSKINV